MPLPTLFLRQDERNDLDIKPGLKHEQCVLRFIIYMAATWSEGEEFGERWWGVDEGRVWEKKDYVVEGGAGGHGCLKGNFAILGWIEVGEF
jgi:hypothetical protein